MNSQEILAKLQEQYMLAKEQGDEAFANTIVKEIQNVLNFEKSGARLQEIAASAKEVEKPAPSDRDLYLARMTKLQDKYGDKDTYKDEPYWPTPWFDETELLKREAKDIYTSGGRFEPPPEPGAWATLGKMMTDAPYAVQQLIPGALSEEDKKDKAQRDLTWAAAEHPLSSELGALALTTLPSFGTMPLAYTAAGKALGSQTIKGFGESMAAKTAGYQTYPKTAAALGASYGGLLVPHATDATPEEAFYERLKNAAVSGLVNYGATHALNVLPDVLRTEQTLARTAGLQKNLPGTSFGRPAVPEMVFDVYGDPISKARFKSYITKPTSTGRRAASADATFKNKFVSTIGDVFEGMFGKREVRPIGSAMNEVWDEFKDRYNTSKNRMNKAYEAIPGNLNMVVSNKGEYNRFVKNLENWLADEGYDFSRGKLGEAVKELKKVSIAKNKPINVNGIKRLVNNLNRIEREIGDAPEMRSSRRAIGKLRADTYDYLANAKWDPAGGRTRDVPGVNVSAIDKWRKAQVLARNHYQRFHGDYDIDNMIAEWQKGTLNENPSDLSSRIFLGSAGTMDVSSGRRVAAIGKLRQGIGNDDFFNPRIKEEALSTLAKGGYKGSGDIDTLIKGVNQHALSGQYSDLFEPDTYTGAPGIFTRKEFNQLKELSGIHRRYADPHTGIGSTTTNETAIPNSWVGRSLQDATDDYGAMRITSEYIKGLLPDSWTELGKEIMNDRIIRRNTAGLLGNYGAAIPASTLGPMVATENSNRYGSRADESYENNKMLAEYLLQNYPTLRGLFEQ